MKTIVIVSCLIAASAFASAETSLTLEEADSAAKAALVQRPAQLPKLDGAPVDYLTVAVKLRSAGESDWKLQSNCRGCKWTMDQVYLDAANNTFEAYFYSSQSERWHTLGTLDKDGKGAETFFGGAGARTVSFNPKLCQGSSCRAARNVIVVEDHLKLQTRVYSTFQQFAAAEGNPFTCEIDAAGMAKCTFNIPGRISQQSQDNGRYDWVCSLTGNGPFDQGGNFHPDGAGGLVFIWNGHDYRMIENGRCRSYPGSDITRAYHQFRNINDAGDTLERYCPCAITD